jgi:hypothetical protein
MTKTTLESPIEKIYPPGTLLPVKLNPEAVGKIKFPERTDRLLLSPLVEAYYNKEKKELLVRAVVFVARKEAKNLDFGIYQNCYIDIESKPQLQFFISFDLVETKETDFFIYEVEFIVSSIPYGVDALSKIEKIQTFLWDIDPVASRGTETPVRTIG